MKKLTQRLWGNEKGFTLIELIIVIAILAIISAVAVPNILSAVDNSRRTTDVANAKVIADAVATIRTQNGSFSGYTGTLTFNATTKDITATAAVSPDTTDTAALILALQKQLGNVAVIPKFKGANNGGSVFGVTLANAQSTAVPVEVWIGTTASQLYPIVDTDYKNQ